MNRRTVLASAGTVLSAAVAGCLGTLADPSENERTDNSGSSENPVYDISLNVTDEDPANGFDVELAIDVITETITETSPAEIRVSLTNNESESITVSSGPGWPFGILTLRRDSSGDETVRVPFWSNRYEESDHIPEGAENVTAADGIAINETVDGGETVEAIYQLHADAKHLEPGTYKLAVSNALEDENRSGGHGLTAVVEITASN